MSETPVLLLLMLASFLLSHLVRVLALRRRWLDHPNERSSHHSPTPKSGGLGFALAYSGALLLFHAEGLLAPGELAALLLALPAALLGLLDDVFNLNIGTRIAGQALLALGVVACLGGLPPLPLPGLDLELGAAGYLIGTLGLVWLVNLYNFMDGIDGLAALEACFVGLAAAFLCWRQGQPDTALLALALAAATAGFLPLNLPPARLFMGDAGSTWLGLILGTLGLLTAARGAMHLWSWAILLGVFVVDTAMTLARRYHRGEIWYYAHRSHAYQHAALQHGSHGRVDLYISLVNFFWLFPLAWISLANVEWAMLIALLAYIPLVFLGNFYNAGKQDNYKIESAGTSRG